MYAFNDSINIRAALEKYKGDFNGDLFETLLTGKDLPHLLFSELQTLTKRLAEEFPEVITVGSIGQSWEHRDLLYVKLDARQAVQAKGAAGAGLASTAPKSTEKKASEAQAGDDDVDKAFGPNV